MKPRTEIRAGAARERWLTVRQAEHRQRKLVKVDDGSKNYHNDA